MFFFYCNASILFQKKAVGHVTWSHDLAQQSLQRQAHQSLPNWPTYCKFASGKDTVMEQLSAHHINKQKIRVLLPGTKYLVRFARHGTNKVCGKLAKNEVNLKVVHLSWQNFLSCQHAWKQVTKSGTTNFQISKLKIISSDKLRIK